MKITGLIPAGGLAERLGKLPCSKEILPYTSDAGKTMVISENLISSYRLAGITHIYFIIRKGKWDIPGYFGDGTDHGVNIGYLTMNLPYGTPFTLNQARPFVKDRIVALGFPDMIFKPEDAFGTLKTKLSDSNAEIVLGVAATDRYLKSDMIEFNNDKTIRRIIIKQNRPDLKYAWFIAMWKPAFTEYMNRFLELFLNKHPDGKILSEDGTPREIYVGDVIQNALSDGMKLDYHLFRNGSYLDIGTMDDLQKLISK
ncbi:MAG TPA: sugar phosphate nucleotidyltransferase [Bacteroidales bacterium]|nr:sugar phosphate nucleotidyltransferase [Bacteroidales bacterium]